MRKAITLFTSAEAAAGIALILVHFSEGLATTIVGIGFAVLAYSLFFHFIVSETGLHKKKPQSPIVKL